MMQRSYLIWNPGQSRRNGPRVLQLLAVALKNAGVTVARFVDRDPSAEVLDGVPVLSRNEITDVIRRDWIVVYPEVVAGNPLRFRNVVRWVLFYPGRNGGNYSYYKGDMIFAFLPSFFPGAPLLTPPWLDGKLFYDDGRERQSDCCFVHKGGRWRDVPETRNLRVITMSDPPSREALAELLRSVRVLYSFDDCSSVLDEAQACGAQVKIITKDGFKEYVSQYPMAVREFPGQLRQFLEMTAQMSWQGPLETRFQWKAKVNSLWLFLIKPMLRRAVGWISFG